MACAPGVSYAVTVPRGSSPILTVLLLKSRSPVSEYNFSCQFSVPSYQLIAGYGPARGPLLLRRLTGGGASPRQLLTVESSNSKLAKRSTLPLEAFVHAAQATHFDDDRSAAGGFAGCCFYGCHATC